MNLKNSDLEGSQLGNVNLRVATLKGANLQNCILRGAVLAGADLEVRFCWLKLKKLDLKKINLLPIAIIEHNSVKGSGQRERERDKTREESPACVTSLVLFSYFGDLPLARVKPIYLLPVDRATFYVYFIEVH